MSYSLCLAMLIPVYAELIEPQWQGTRAGLRLMEMFELVCKAVGCEVTRNTRTSSSLPSSQRSGESGERLLTPISTNPESDYVFFLREKGSDGKVDFKCGSPFRVWAWVLCESARRYVRREHGAIALLACAGGHHRGGLSGGCCSTRCVACKLLPASLRHGVYFRCTADNTRPLAGTC